MFLTRWINTLRSVRHPEKRAAWTIALGADLLQLAVFPLFAAGALSAADTVLDLVVAWLLSWLLGWHWAFLPSFAAELVPGLDLFPTWTAAVYFVTRGDRPGSEPEILPPEPAEAPRA